MPEKPMDIVWVVYGNEKINPKKGRVIYINEKQLRKLKHYNIYKNEEIEK